MAIAKQIARINVNQVHFCKTTNNFREVILLSIAAGQSGFDQQNVLYAYSQNDI